MSVGDRTESNVEATNIVPEARLRLGVLLVLCKGCGGRCYAGSSPDRVAYYYCKECGKGQKVTRTR